MLFCWGKSTSHRIFCSFRRRSPVLPNSPDTDLIVEILSPGNSSKEMDLKYDLYQENGVKEYWIANPVQKTILIYVLENDKYVGLKPLTENNRLQSVVFSKLKFNLEEVFEN